MIQCNGKIYFTQQYDVCNFFTINADFFAGIGYQVAVAFAKSGAEKVDALSRSQSE